jgi:hypothetical protein
MGKLPGCDEANVIVNMQSWSKKAVELGTSCLNM